MSSSFGDVFRDRRVLVTGHTGFKGAWLTAWLLRLGAWVCGYAIDVPTVPSLFEQAALAGRIEHHLGDVRDAQAVQALVQAFRPEVVVHLAAQPIVSLSYRDPLGTISTNVMGTASLLEALRTVDWPCAAVLVASDKCYENLEQPWGYREIDPLGGKDVYSASKAAAEIVFSAYARSFFATPGHPVRLASARAGNVIGGGDWAADRIVADAMRAWARGEPVRLRRPEAVRPWQHVLEPLSGYLALAARLMREPGLGGESFNFGPPPERPCTVRRLLEDLRHRFDPTASGPGYEALAAPPFAEAGRLLLNCDKARAALDWEPTCRFEETVRLTADWYSRVLQAPDEAAAMTGVQIAQYEALARSRGRAWAG